MWTFIFYFEWNAFVLVLKAHIAQSLCFYLWMASISVIDVEALAVESGFYSGGPLLILALSLSCNLIFY